MTRTVVFDAEPLVAHAFDEPGADAVDEWLDGLYSKAVAGWVATPNLAELRYVIARTDSPSVADDYLAYLHDIGLKEYGVDGLWHDVAELKLSYNPSLGDAYALATAAALDDDADGDETILLIGADDDFDGVTDDASYGPRIERFRDDAV